MERRDPAICTASNIGEGKDEVTKASIGLQDLRRRIYGKARLNRPGVSGVFRRHLAHAQKRQGFGWERWSRRWLYVTLGLFNGYRVRRDRPKVASAG